MKARFLFTLLVPALFLAADAAAEPDLRAEKNVGLAVDADGDGRVSPGDVLAYSLRVQNAGETAATAVTLTDAIPFATTLVPGSIFVSSGTVVAENPIVVEIGELAGNLTSVSIGFRVEIADPVPPGTSAITNQGTVSSAELPDIVTDDPSTPEPGDATLAALPAAPRTVDVPALGPAAILAMAALAAAAALARIRREDKNAASKQ